MEDHYGWLEENLPVIFQSLGLNTELCSSLITAHRDKCDSAKSLFEQHGIHFYHGCAMYLLGRVEPYCSEVRGARHNRGFLQMCCALL